MSMTISTIATDPTARNSSAGTERFKAVSSALGPCQPDVTSSRAIRVDFAYSTVARAIAAAGLGPSPITPLAPPEPRCGGGP
jgi:hypothetical protein